MLKRMLLVVIHACVGKIQLKRSKLHANSSKPDKDDSKESSKDISGNDDVQETRFGRKTKLLVWMQDYVQ